MRDLRSFTRTLDGALAIARQLALRILSLMTSRTMLGFRTLFARDEDSFNAWCPALKGRHAFGLSEAGAERNTREAILLWRDIE